MFLSGVHRNFTFIPLLNTFLIYFKPVPPTIYLLYLALQLSAGYGLLVHEVS
jgi:hypothetical protein